MFEDKNQDIIVISSIDWKTQRQVVHELTEYLSEGKNRILFIENTGVRSISIKKDYKRMLSRLKVWLGSSKGFTKKNDNLTIYTPLFFPFFIYSKISLWINSLIITNLVMYWLKFKKFKSPIIISFLSTPLAQSLVKNINPKATIFYCIDNMSESSSSARKLKEWENIFFKDSDLVMCTSKEILFNAKKLNKNSIYAPSGVDYEKFSKILLNNELKKPEDLPTKGPIIGFVGGLRNILDKDLLYKICDEFEDANLVLIGPTFDAFKLDYKKNLTILGSKDHDKIPIYVKFFDVAIIPYLKNEFTDSIYPTKINEYLAMGKPVVSTNIKEVENFNLEHSSIIKISNKENEFLKMIKEILNSDINKNYNLSIETAKRNSWKNRFNLISESLTKYFPFSNEEDDTWSNYLQSFLKKTRIKILKNFSIILALFLIIFKSPLFPYLEKNLYTFDAFSSDKKNDAVVIFSGHGSSEYNNFDYRIRYVDAKFYISKLPSADIYIYGRSSVLKDSEIIKSLLVERDNISSDRIFLIETKMKNTFENLRVIREILLNKKIKNVLFITAPIHSKRVKKIWMKNIKEINIIMAKTLDPHFNQVRWGMSYKKIKAVTYEYCAIIYNYARGWL